MARWTRAMLAAAVCLGLVLAAAPARAEEEEDEAEEAAAAADEPQMPVIDLEDEADFDGLIKEGLVVVEFYVPWCPHCKKVAPEYIRAAMEMKDEATFVGVNGDLHPVLKDKYDVAGFPYFMAWYNGKGPVVYHGGRSEPEITSWARLLNGPVVEEVADEEDVEELVDKFYTVVCGFFPSADHRQAKRFRAVAAQQRNVTKFVVSYDADFAAEEGTSQPGVIVYQRFDEGKQVMDPYDPTKLNDFIKRKRYPLFDLLSIVNYNGYLTRGYPLVYLYVKDFRTQEPEVKALYDTMRQLARVYEGQFSFLALDEDHFTHFMEEMKMDTAKFPALAVSEQNKLAYRYPQDEELTPETLERFLSDYLANKITPIDTDTSKRQDGTTEASTAPDTSVITLTADNIKSVVNDKKKDVFVKFYAPWCGHCKRMEPAWKRLASEFAEYKDIVIAQYNADAAADAIPKKFNIKGYPTLYWVNKRNQAIKYTKERDFTTMRDFINENRGKKL